MGQDDTAQQSGGGQPTSQPVPGQQGMTPPPPPPKVEPETGANVILRDGKALAEGPLILGRTKVTMPPEVQQRAGFAVEAKEVSKLIEQFPQFKRFNPMGNR